MSCPGVIQCTDRDEFSYQEMITHLPLCSLQVGLGGIAVPAQTFLPIQSKMPVIGATCGAL